MNTTCARSTDRDSVLAQLLEEYLVSCEAGRPLTADELVHRFPEFAADVKACLASLDFVRHAAQAQRSGPTPESMANGPGLSGGPSGTLGDYSLIREIGRGGMGVVYEAEQISLGRRVALKVLPFASLLDERALKRFKNEAQAAAVIDHPHIVDIYGVGQERGVHFYAMRLIEGPTLAEVIAELRGDSLTPESDSVKCDPQGCATAAPHSDDELRATDSPPQPTGLSETVARADATIHSIHSKIPTGKAYYRFIAQLGMAVAEALDHAHQQGVIHRDIKPSNLMLDAHGKVWITDFGLAHIESNASMTHTGDMLGTLRYMSPEQILSKRGAVDDRSDVYSLGATLYELLTLRPAFTGENRHELLRQISSEDPVSPRNRYPEIPAELETIVLKTLEKSPSDRYHDAHVLADDLRRFLSDEPIRARRPTLLGRVRKWSRRHRQVVTTVLVLASVGLLIGGVLLLREQAKTRAALAKAKAQTARVRQVVGDFFVEVTQNPRLLRDEPDTDELRRKLLDRARTYYESMLAEDLSDPGLKLDVALARCRLARITLHLRPSRETLDMFVEGLAMLDQLAPEQVFSLETTRERAESYQALGRLQKELGHFRDSLESKLTALTLFRQAWLDHRDNVVLGTQVAGTSSDVGMMQIAVGDLRGATESLGSALRIGMELWQEHPGNIEVAHSLANTSGNLANLLLELGRDDEAAIVYQKALAIVEPLVASRPEVKVLRADLAYHLKYFGLLKEKQSNQHDSPDEALDYLNQAIAIYLRLSHENPSSPGAAHCVAAVQIRVAEILAVHGRLDESQRSAQDAVRILDRISQEHPAVWDLADSLAAALDVGARVSATVGNSESARSYFARAIEIREELWQRHPQIAICGEGLAQCLIHFADFHQAAGRSEDSIANVDRAIEVLDQCDRLRAPKGTTVALRDTARTIRTRAITAGDPPVPLEEVENGARTPPAVEESR